MARAMKPETEIRHLKREIAYLKRDGQAAHDARLVAQTANIRYRQQAEKAEQEAAEWKRRFDALLLKLPDVPKEMP